MMDWQTAFNVTAALAGFFGGLWVSRIMRMQERISEELQQLHTQHLPRYVRRDDFNHALDVLLKKLDKIDSKLDTKADK